MQTSLKSGLQFSTKFSSLSDDHNINESSAERELKLFKKMQTEIETRLLPREVKEPNEKGNFFLFEQNQIIATDQDFQLVNEAHSQQDRENTLLFSNKKEEQGKQRGEKGHLIFKKNTQLKGYFLNDPRLNSTFLNKAGNSRLNKLNLVYLNSSPWIEKQKESPLYFPYSLSLKNGWKRGEEFQGSDSIISIEFCQNCLEFMKFNSKGDVEEHKLTCETYEQISKRLQCDSQNCSPKNGFLNSKLEKISFLFLKGQVELSNFNFFNGDFEQNLVDFTLPKIQMHIQAAIQENYKLSLLKRIKDRINQRKLEFQEIQESNPIPLATSFLKILNSVIIIIQAKIDNISEISQRNTN